MRPFRVTILVLIVLCYTFLNGLRFTGALTHWNTLAQYGAQPAYIAASGLTWATVGLILAILLYRGHRYGSRAGLIGSVLYFAWYWMDRLFLQANPAPNTTYSLFFSSILLLAFITTLLTKRSKDFYAKERA